MKELVSLKASRRDLRMISRSRLLEQYWLSSSFYGAYAQDKSAIPSGVFLGEKKDFPLNDGLGVGRANQAPVLYSFQDGAGAYAIASSLYHADNISLLPRITGLLTQGLTLERLEGKEEGWSYLKEALLLGEKDHLIMPFALCLELIPFLTRFAALQGGDSSYRAALLHEALYHQSVLPHSKRAICPLFRNGTSNCSAISRRGRAGRRSPIFFTSRRTPSRASFRSFTGNSGSIPGTRPCAPP